MRKLPYPIQKLYLGEQEHALDLITEGARPARSVANDLTCDSPFFQKWQLPCADMWIQEEFLGRVLDQDHVWDKYAFMFSENCFEIYKSMEKSYTTQELFEEIGAPTKRRLDVSLAYLPQILFCN